MIAYKLFRQRSKGDLAPLFINRKQTIPIGKWLMAESYPTKGYAVRPGWHCCPEPKAPHLTTKGRVWCEVEIKDWIEIERPQGLWLIAQRMKVNEILY